jgi:BlaI family transcriptional regulator, penicillinase repressor
MAGKDIRRTRGKQKVPLPTTAEVRLLQILWDKGEATVEDVVNAHIAKKKPNYKTIQTLLRIMEQKGFITHEAQGRVFVFKPLISRKTVDHGFVKALLSQNFKGSASGLLVNLLEASPVDQKELDELEAYLREYRKRSQLDDPHHE